MLHASQAASGPQRASLDETTWLEAATTWLEAATEDASDALRTLCSASPISALAAFSGNNSYRCCRHPNLNTIAPSAGWPMIRRRTFHRLLVQMMPLKPQQLGSKPSTIWSDWIKP